MGGKQIPCRLYVCFPTRLFLSFSPTNQRERTHAAWCGDSRSRRLSIVVRLVSRADVQHSSSGHSYCDASLRPVFPCRKFSRGNSTLAFWFTEPPNVLFLVFGLHFPPCLCFPYILNLPYNKSPRLFGLPGRFSSTPRQLLQKGWIPDGVATWYVLSGYAGCYFTEPAWPAPCCRNLLAPASSPHRSPSEHEPLLLLKACRAL